MVTRAVHHRDRCGAPRPQDRSARTAGGGTLPAWVLDLQRAAGNRAVQGLLVVQRNGVVTVEDVEEGQAPRQDADAEELDLLPPDQWNVPVTTPSGGMSYPVHLPVLSQEQRARNAERLRARRATDEAAMPTFPAILAGPGPGPVLPMGSGGRSYPAHLPALSEEQLARNAGRVRARRAADEAVMPTLPGLLIAGAGPGAAHTEAEAAAQWNAAQLPALQAAVEGVRSQHAHWSATLDTLRATIPTITRLLLDPPVPALLRTLVSACDGFDSEHAGQVATPTVRGFHAATAAHDRVQAAMVPALATAFGPAGPLTTVGQAFAGLPQDRRTVLEGCAPATLRVLIRLPIVDIAGLGTLPPEVIDRFDAMPIGDVTTAIANRTTAAAEVTHCKAAFATFQTSLPTVADVPEGMATGTSKDLREKITREINNTRRDARVVKTALLNETGSTDPAAPQCLWLWFLPQPAAADLTAKVSAAAVQFARCKANVVALAGFLQVTPTGGTQNSYWYLNEHLRKPGGQAQEPKLGQILTDLAANAVGWTPNAAMTDLLDTAYYLYTGWGQSSIDTKGKGSKKRGAGVLETVRYDPSNTTSGWMPHVRTLRTLAVGPRHSHPTVRLVYGTNNPMLHSTDPARLGAYGSKSVPASQVDSKPGARTLTGGSRGYEYSIPGFSGARLIETPRGDTANWADASWYLSLGHYEAYQLITNLP